MHALGGARLIRLVREWRRRSRRSLSSPTVPCRARSDGSALKQDRRSSPAGPNAFATDSVTCANDMAIAGMLPTSTHGDTAARGRQLGFRWQSIAGVRRCRRTGTAGQIPSSGSANAASTKSVRSVARLQRATLRQRRGGRGVPRSRPRSAAARSAAAAGARLPRICAADFARVWYLSLLDAELDRREAR